MDGGAWWAAVHGVAKSRTWMSKFTFTFHFHALEREMAAHSSLLAWRIPGTGEPGGLPSMGSHRVGHDWSDLAAAYSPWGCKESDLTEQLSLSLCVTDSRSIHVSTNGPILFQYLWVISTVYMYHISIHLSLSLTTDISLHKDRLLSNLKKDWLCDLL